MRRWASSRAVGLAPIVSVAVMDALLAIALKDGAMVIAEQNLALLSGHCNRTLGMHAGQLKGND